MFCSCSPLHDFATRLFILDPGGDCGWLSQKKKKKSRTLTSEITPRITIEVLLAVETTILVASPFFNYSRMHVK
jgi:hypothetical protein